MDTNITEFRKNTKKYFDAALQGEEVMIERGSVFYKLEAILPKNTPEKKSEATPTSVADLISEPAQTAVMPDLEKECCQNPYNPCTHWVWDSSTGEGYRNSLSGRFMEVE